MGKNLIERLKDMKAEKNQQKEKGKAEMISRLGEALMKMRVSKESMQNKLMVELQLARKDIARHPNDMSLKNRHYQKIKMYYSFYKYSGMMLDQLELKNDEVMMGQGMAEFAETMRVAGILVAQPIEDMPNIDKLIRSIREGMQDSGKQFEAVDKLLAGVTEAQDKSLAIASCSDELVDGLLSGTISLDGELSDTDVPVLQADDKEEIIRQMLDAKI